MIDAPVPPAPTEPELSPEQLWAAETVMSKDLPASILTGAAGTGKSTVIRYLRDNYDVTVCATTGKAAMNIGGHTVDRVFSINRTNWSVRSQRTLEENMSIVGGTILIDEASMVGYEMAELIASAALAFDKKIILVGDWGQAKPVKDDWPMLSRLFTNATFVKLEECHRQSSSAYLSALNRVRIGEHTEEDSDLFRSRTSYEPPAQTFNGVCLVATIKLVNSYNSTCLAKHCFEHDQKPTRLETKFEDGRNDFMKTTYPLDAAATARLIDDSGFAHMEYVAVGCKIVITRNLAEPYNLVNGDVGVVTELRKSDRAICLEITRKGVTFPVELREQLLEQPGLGDEKAVYRFTGYPLRLGYGVTIHKAQGMTVDNAWVDMNSICHHPEGSRHGLAYVALSRTRAIEGLHVSGWNTDAIEVDDVVRKWL